MTRSHEEVKQVYRSGDWQEIWALVDYHKSNEYAFADADRREKVNQP